MVLLCRFLNWDHRVEVIDDVARTPKLGFDAAGNAVAVWRQGGGQWAGRFTPTGGWSEAERIDDETGLAGRFLFLLVGRLY